MSDDKKTHIGPGSYPVATGAPTWGDPTARGAAMPTVAAPVYVPPTDPLIGQVLAGRYQIQKKLGEGGMGAVYLAQHIVLEKAVALKVLHGEFARKPDLVERFMQEAKAASRIRHENVIDISDFGVAGEGLVFFAMELLNGHDLHEDIARARLDHRRLPWEKSRKIFLQICAALSAAHAQGIVHRDLKPENIYLVEWLGHKDFVKLLDFGIAKLTEVSEGDRKLTRTGMLFGTPEYMSPEQARGENVDHRVDIYAMGCILYQLVTGRVPFEAENFMGILSLHLTEMPPPIDPGVFNEIAAPRGLEAIIMKALAKSRDERWQTIDEMANAIRALHGEAAQPINEVRVPRALTPGPAPGGRQKTEWRGNLQVPVEDDLPIGGGRQRAVWPFVVGGVVVVGVGIAIAVVAMGGSKKSSPGDGTGSQPVAVIDAAADVLPARVTIKLDSDPQGADIFDVTANAVVGATPFEFSLPGSREPRRFTFKLAGYAGKMIELLPVEDVAYKVPLVKVAPGSAAGSAAVAAVAEIEVVPQKARPGGRKPIGATGGSAVGSSGGSDVGPVTMPGSDKPPTGGSDKPPVDKPPVDKPPGDHVVHDKPPVDKPPVDKPPGSGTGSGTGSDKPDDEPVIKIKDPFANPGGDGGSGSGSATP